MVLYQGQKCPVCNEKFTEQDDVVVCPECGTPHHRNCYQQAGHCFNSEQHDNDFSWKPEALPNQLASQTGQVQCPRCGMTNPTAEQNCRQCGIPLIKERPAASASGDEEAPSSQQPAASKSAFSQEPYAQLSAMEVEGISFKDLLTFVRKNPMYFLDAFSLLAKRPSFLSVNWAALLLNFFYFFYRKMYKYGFMVLGALFIFKLPSLIILFKVWPQYMEMLPTFMADFSKIYSFVPNFTGLETLQLLGSIGDYLVLFSSVMCGFLANRLYLRHCISKVKEIRQRVNPEKAGYLRYQQELLAKGNTSIQAVVLLILALFAAFYGLSFLLASMTIM